jgi:hypothetical protein
MTFTKSTWATIAVARVEADYVAVRTTADGTERAQDANMALTQVSQDGSQRRTILGVVDVQTCEIIPAPDIAGFKELRDAQLWAARTVSFDLR